MKRLFYLLVDRNGKILCSNELSFDVIDYEIEQILYRRNDIK